MVDFYESLSSRDIERSRHRCRLEKAIERTRRLLASPKASENPELAMKWSQRLQRQEANFMGVCR
jgi:hypothetical protein